MYRDVLLITRCSILTEYNKPYAMSQLFFFRLSIIRLFFMNSRQNKEFRVIFSWKILPLGRGKGGAIIDIKRIKIIKRISWQNIHP